MPWSMNRSWSGSPGFQIRDTPRYCASTARRCIEARSSGTPAAARRSQNRLNSSALSAAKRPSRISQSPISRTGSTSPPFGGHAGSSAARITRAISGESSIKPSRDVARRETYVGCRQSGGNGRTITNGIGRGSHREFGERGPVDLDAEAGPVPALEPPGALHDRLLQHRHADRVLGLVEFEQRLERVKPRRV